MRRLSGWVVLSILVSAGSGHSAGRNAAKEVRRIFDGANNSKNIPVLTLPADKSFKSQNSKTFGRTLSIEEVIPELEKIVEKEEEIEIPKAPPAPTPHAAKAPTKKKVNRGDQAGIDALAWAGNLTWGLVNTLMGLLIILGASLIMLFGYGMLPKFSVSPTGGQFIVDTRPVAMGALSMGIFHIGDPLTGYKHKDVPSHETGHARQSAVLGPLYLPVVLLSYAIGAASGKRAFVEEWADDWGG